MVAENSQMHAPEFTLGTGSDPDGDIYKAQNIQLTAGKESVESWGQGFQNRYLSLNIATFLP